MATASTDYLLHLADNALVLGQRNAEWCGHGPILEEDLALANNSLDLVGQARLLYQQVAERLNAADEGPSPALRRLAPSVPAAALPGGLVTEDTLAYFRDVSEFRNYTLLELPHSTALASTARGDRDYAVTITRNLLYSALMVLVWERLLASRDETLAAIAAKSLKEVRYHLRHAGDWLVRMGDGTEHSHARAQAALDHLMPYTAEFWAVSATESEASADGTGVDPLALRGEWDALIDHWLGEATLTRTAPQAWVPTGKQGVHSEHLGFMLAEMQSLARAHPGAQW
jgi:ring-1,2-phenylacetyl-CoA epoxidase subunit PaaC